MSDTSLPLDSCIQINVLMKVFSVNTVLLKGAVSMFSTPDTAQTGVG